MIKLIDKSESKNKYIERIAKLILEECGQEGEFVIVDWDLDRIYLEKEQDKKEYIIRTWNIRENNKGKTVIDWTLYQMRGDGSAADKSLGNGKTIMKIEE